MQIIARAGFLIAASSLLIASTASAQKAAVVKDAHLNIPLTTTSADAKAQFIKGVLAGDAGRTDDARAAFEASTKADPKFAVGHLGNAMVAPSTETWVAHVKSASDNAAKASPAEQAWIETFAKALASDSPGQLAAAQKFTTLAPDAPRAWQQVGDAYLTLGKTEDARAAYKKAITLAPNAAFTHAALGNSMLSFAPFDFAGAEVAFKKVVELEPKQGQSHDLLGDVYRAQNKLELARDSYSKGAELEPTNAMMFQQRGHANSFLGAAEAARADYDKAIALSKGNERINFAMFRANVSLYEGKAKAAMDEFRAAGSSAEKLPGIVSPQEVKLDALYMVAMIAAHNGMFKEAKAAIDEAEPIAKALAKNTTSVDARRGFEVGLAFNRAFVAACQGDAAAVKASTDEITKLIAVEANPRKLEGVHALLGHAALTQKKYPEALAELKQADFNSVYVRYNLARAYEGAGKADDAKKLYKEVAIFNFNGTDYALVRAAAVAKAK